MVARLQPVIRSRSRIDADSTPELPDLKWIASARCWATLLTTPANSTRSNHSLRVGVPCGQLVGIWLQFSLFLLFIVSPFARHRGSDLAGLLTSTFRPGRPNDSL